MNDELAIQLTFSLIKLLHFRLGWDEAQRDLCRVGEEFVDNIFEKGEVKVSYGDTDAILKSISDVLVKRYGAASAIKVEIANEIPLARAAIMPPYRISVKNCIFCELHKLIKKNSLRRKWKRNLETDGLRLFLCPMMNFLVHAIDINSDYLAGHCLGATEIDGETCICLIDVFSREIDVINRPEEENPECYRIK